MSYEFKLPDIGEGISEAEVVKLHVKEGDDVQEDQPLVEIMTDKVNTVIPCPVSGKIEKVFVKEGERVRVGQTIILIQPSAGGAVQTGVTGAEKTIQADVAAAPERTVQAQTATGRILATPAVRKLARELNVPIEKVRGSGPLGRITEEDVKNFSVAQSRQVGQTQMRKPDQNKGEERIPLTGIRRAIADKMVKSAYTIPHVTHFEEIDVTELVRLRERVRQATEARGIKITYLPFVVKAVCTALPEFPAFNASIDQEKGEIIFKKYYNIGVATATDQGLIVPVIHDADKKSLLEIASEVAKLSDAARQGKLSIQDVQGGTFSITNIGAIGGVFATPIINFPESAILGLYRVVQRPALTPEGKAEVRSFMNVSLTFDHRITDGAVAASFVNRIKQILEDPGQLYGMLV